MPPAVPPWLSLPPQSKCNDDIARAIDFLFGGGDVNSDTEPPSPPPRDNRLDIVNHEETADTDSGGGEAVIPQRGYPLELGSIPNDDGIVKLRNPSSDSTEVLVDEDKAEFITDEFSAFTNINDAPPEYIDDVWTEIALGTLTNDELEQGPPSPPATLPLP